MTKPTKRELFNEMEAAIGDISDSRSELKEKCEAIGTLADSLYRYAAKLREAEARAEVAEKRIKELEQQLDNAEKQIAILTRMTLEAKP